MIFHKRCFDRDSMELEAAALVFYDEAGCVRLLGRDENTCTLNIEQVVPGTTLKSLFPFRDDDAVKMVISSKNRSGIQSPQQYLGEHPSAFLLSENEPNGFVAPQSELRQRICPWALPFFDSEMSLR